jgi:ribonucleoside-diphosphate reductase beta chain
MKDLVVTMFEEAIDCEMAFANDILDHGVAGLSGRDMKTYLQFIADQRLERLGMPHHFGAKNPFGFMELQDTQELANFFERRVSAYQIGVTGQVKFDESF